MSERLVIPMKSISVFLLEDHAWGSCSFLNSRRLQSFFGIAHVEITPGDPGVTFLKSRSGGPGAYVFKSRPGVM